MKYFALFLALVTLNSCLEGDGYKSPFVAGERTPLGPTPAPEGPTKFDSFMGVVGGQDCLLCHAPDTKELGGGHDFFLTEEQWLESDYIEPGLPDESEIVIRLMKEQGEVGAMPPREPLDQADINSVKDWILSLNKRPNAEERFQLVKNFLTENCISCHSETNQSAGIRLDYETEEQFVSTSLVVVGDLANSPVYSSLKGSNAGGTENMPVGNNLPTADEIKLMRDWILKMAPISAADVRFNNAKRIVDAKCTNCHNANTPTAAFRADFNTEQEFVDQGLIVANNPAMSILFSVIRGSGVGGQEDMPTNQTLTAQEIESLRVWIEFYGMP